MICSAMSKAQEIFGINSLCFIKTKTINQQMNRGILHYTCGKDFFNSWFHTMTFFKIMDTKYYVYFHPYHVFRKFLNMHMRKLITLLGHVIKKECLYLHIKSIWIFCSCTPFIHMDYPLAHVENFYSIIAFGNFRILSRFAKRNLLIFLLVMKYKYTLYINFRKRLDVYIYLYL